MLEHPNIQYNSPQRQASLLAQLRQKGHLIEKTTLYTCQLSRLLTAAGQFLTPD